MKKLGFGCMRLPVLASGEVDIDLFCRMSIWPTGLPISTHPMSIMRERVRTPCGRR